MLYAKQTDNGFHIANIKVFFPDTSFPETGPNTEWLAQASVYPIQENFYFDSTNFKRVGVNPFLKDGIVYTAELLELTSEEKNQIESDRLAIIASSVREQRNKLLAESDWTQLADSVVDKQIWADYRKKLRDISDQPGFPESIDWPVTP